MPRGEVPYSRVECNWWAHHLARMGSIRDRYVYDRLYTFAVHEKRDVLPTRDYPNAYLAYVCAIQTRTMQRARSKLVADGRLLRELPDGSLVVMGVRVKNKSIAWKNPDPNSPIAPQMSLARASPSPSPPPSPLPIAQRGTKREGELVQRAYFHVYDRLPRPDQPTDVDWHWAKKALESGNVGDDLDATITEHMTTRHHYKTPENLLRGIAENQYLPKTPPVNTDGTGKDW